MEFFGKFERPHDVRDRIRTNRLKLLFVGVKIQEFLDTIYTESQTCVDGPETLVSVKFIVIVLVFLDGNIRGDH